MDVEVGELPAFLRLSLAGDGVRFSLLEGSGFGVQGLQVLFGPPQLRPDSFK